MTHGFASLPERISPADRRSCLAAILALGVSRYRHLSAATGADPLPELSAQGLEFPAKTRLSVSRENDGKARNSQPETNDARTS